MQTSPCNSADLLKANMRASIIGTEMQHQEIQHRIVSVLLAGMMLFDFIDPAVLILSVPSSVIGRIGHMTQEANFIAFSFLTLASLLLPYVFMTVFCPRHPMRRDCTRVACLALAGAGVLWFLMAWTARNTEFPYVMSIFLRSGLGAMLFSLSLALSLNNELARTLLDK